MNVIKSPLVTDLYQLTMLQGYIDQDLHDTAVFEFFVRDMPETRNFFLAAGLDSVLVFLEECRFSEKELDYLAGTGRFNDSLITYLKKFRFTGDVHAMPEGTVFFPHEPIIRITAPLPEAQLVESRLINLIHYQSLIATKAARCTIAAGGQASLVDFGLRRTHGADAGLFAARSSYIAGYAGTATVIAEPLFGIPIFGTMAHSFVEAQKSEKEAFLNFALSNPDNVTLLIDTYNTVEGARKAVETAEALTKTGIKVRGVRLDSGNLAQLSREVRTILDAAGLDEVSIFVSGNMDEYSIHDLLQNGAPIGGFGVGTRVNTSADVPYFDSAYKLTEYAGTPRLKKSEGKATLPGRKQVHRHFENGIMVKDVLTIEDDPQEGRPLVRQYMSHGKRITRYPTVHEIRDYTSEQIRMLPPYLKALNRSSTYPVEISAALTTMKEKLERTMGV